MSVKFKYLEMYAPSKGQHFEKDFVERAGKVICVDDWIQAGREDTEIYPTLEKYGCIDRMVLDTEGVYADVSASKDLRGSLEQIKEANKIWENLPIDVRKEFNNDKYEFMDRGEKWLKSKLNKEKEVKETAISGVAETANPEVVENGK